MPVLDRQAVSSSAPATRAPGAPRVPDRIAETAPTPLQRHYINLSAIALVAGFVAITALETGSTLASPLVKLCILVGGPVLLLTTGDAALRFWRSAWAWLPVNRGRGLFRFSWVLAALLGIVIVGAAWIAALLA